MSKKAKSAQQTKVVTTTTTSMRDIGLTGQHAVDLANVIQAGSIDRAMVHSSDFQALLQTTGQTYQKLIGGASDLIQTGAVTQLKAAEQLEKLGEMKEKTEFERMLPMIAIAGVGLIIAIKAK